MKTVNATKIVSGYGEIFSDVRLSAKNAKAIPNCDLYERKSHSSVFGIAFNLMLDYELYRKGFVKNYYPKGPFNDESKKRIGKLIDRKKEFSPKQVYTLVRAEQKFRSGLAGYDEEGELSRLMIDFPKLKELVEYSLIELFKGKSNVVVNPVFGNSRILVHADGDFILDNVLYEIKCTNQKNCTTMTIRQLMIYYMLNDLLKDEYKITKFGYYNPLRKQKVEFDIEIPELVKDKWEKFVKERYWEYVLSRKLTFNDIKDMIKGVI